MALGGQCPSKHNTLLGLNDRVTTAKIPHPQSTRFYDEAVDADNRGPTNSDASEYTMFGTPGAKRRKIEGLSNGVDRSLPRIPETPGRTEGVVWSPLRRKVKEEVPDSEEEDDLLKADHEIVQATKRTHLEEALPYIQSDEEAIEAYEVQRAAGAAEAAQKLKNVGEDDETAEARMANRSWKRGKSSIYLDAFNLALSTVLEEESHLFDDAEKQVFQYFSNLSYEAQFLYVRLFLRKTSTWFRVAKLGYYNDIADIPAAVEELQIERKLPKGDPIRGEWPGEPEIPDEAAPLGDDFVFAECSNDQITTLNEASSLLLLDELKVLAKDAKVKGKNKSELLQNLRRTSGKQRGLGFLKRSETEGSATSGKSTPAPEFEDDTGAESEVEHLFEHSATPSNDENRDSYFTRKILDQTGKCVRLSLIPLKLFERVHLVFYRSIEWTENSLTTLILAKIARRNFPEYVVSRSTNIFESRAMLLEFESCLRLQFRVENTLEFSGYASREDLENIRALFEKVHPRGKALLKLEQNKEERVYESGEGPYLRRFSPAWVYTRVAHKVLPVLARFKEHLREHSLLSELLDQRLFHPSKRGAWYQRKALLEEHYMYALTDNEGRSEEVNKKHWKRIALHTSEAGLQDRECHIRYHYDLQKRIKKLERQLKIPRREQHDFGHVGLLKPLEREITGIQIVRDQHVPLRRKSSTGNNNNNNSATSATSTTPTQTPPPPQTQSHSDPTPFPTTKLTSTKTIWLDELDTNLPVSVESLTLSHYRQHHNYKGYHTEGGILRTLFGLLFYDVLFTYVPNVFQTAYQTCPLDLHTDAFYSTRISEINHRINSLSNGDAASILRDVWTKHSARKTCIVGVRWDYDFSDLLEIVACWDGAALGTIMRVLAQEYGERGGGVPDLFLWKAGEGGKVLFVEVKSENDRLSDSQRLWISVLMHAGVDVELCHVKAKEVRREDGTVIRKED